MNKTKETAATSMAEAVFEPPAVNPPVCSRRAVVQSIGSQLPYPDEAMLPMPPHNKPLNMGKLRDHLRQKTNLLSALSSRLTAHLLQLLKRRL